ncbi:hypothetical protein EDB81DRAFT_773952 [Dactylonectria macrodidyma]|uniref:Uncharacterized protein n=1 Tax=Dactylonectria macrodidyma TaxID=307937 RepID=A0A9P9FUT9_9HYPO|nr:hypothetical protein EDB81DRAFT_773952 [Dactylonectria macrodidyma]
MVIKLLIATAVFAATTVAYQSNEYGGVGPNVLCVYPLSGLYTPFQRILFYLLLSYGVLGRGQPWLVAGALASAMSYSGAAAIHSILLVKISSRPYDIDLDIYGVFAITSTGFMLAWPLLTLSTTMRRINKEVRIVIFLWTFLMLLSAILAVSTIYAKEKVVVAPDCLPHEEALALAISVFQIKNCTYACFKNEHQPFRSPPSILAWANNTDAASAISGVFVPTAAASLSTVLIVGFIDLIWIRRGDGRRVSDYIIPSPSPVLKKFELGWLVCWLLRRLRRLPSATMSSCGPQNRDRHYIKTTTQYFVIFIWFSIFIINTSLNEYRFRHFPKNEEEYEVGQWAPWVSVLLVVAAQIISHFSKNMWRKKKCDEEICGLGPIRSSTGQWCQLQETRCKTSSSRFKRRNSF